MNFDILIVGGNMVGASLACALADSPLNIALIDAAEFSANDPRLIALNDSSYRLFKNLKLWETLSQYASAINEVHVSYRGRFGSTQIKASEMKMAALGHVVPAKFINSVLNEKILAAKNVTIFRPASLNHFYQDENGVTAEITMDSRTQILNAKILVGADGTHSTVRDKLNFSVETYDYQQSALVTTTELHRSHHHIAYERFHQSGAIAMLPLSENKVATIWTDHNDTIQQLLQLSDEDFLQKLQKTFGYRLGRLEKISQRFSYPLKMIKTKKRIENRVILIGNAAHTLHPVAAQGFNLALHEIALLSEELLQNNFSLKEMLDENSQHSASVRLSHILPAVFSQDFLMLGTLRQLGMVGLDLIHPLKKRFAMSAMGKAKKIPLLML
jgi:2-octaprenyl-6-methoxyphenol hydroxylase